MQSQVLENPERVKPVVPMLRIPATQEIALTPRAGPSQEANQEAGQAMEHMGAPEGSSSGLGGHPGGPVPPGGMGPRGMGYNMQGRPPWEAMQGMQGMQGAYMGQNPYGMSGMSHGMNGMYTPRMSGMYPGMHPGMQSPRMPGMGGMGGYPGVPQQYQQAPSPRPSPG